jgi:prepilin peptidase CpaA
MKWALLILAATATWFDLRERKIPNWLTIPALVAGLLLNRWDGAAGALLGAAFYLPGFLLGMAGGGDVKLLAAVGALAGWRDGLTVLVFSLVANGILALVAAARKERWKPLAPAVLAGVLLWMAAGR